LQGSATGINNQGVIVGYSNSNPLASPPDRAVLFDESGAHDLGLLPGYAGARPLAINDQGDVVGEAQGLDSRNRAAFLVTDGRMWDLNDLAPSSLNLVQAVGISATGIIAGTATNRGHVSAFLVVPVIVP
jgi:probable HAF family extracellular repeat protein